MTFSIVGRCERTGMLGVGISTSSISVGSRCPWIRERVGAVTSQNMTDPRIGPAVLDQLAQGLGAKDALARVTSSSPGIDYRQIAVVDAKGGTAQFTGAKAFDVQAEASGKSCVALGNILKNKGVPPAMVKAFGAGADQHLAERLLRGLEAGLAAGGETGPVHSAAIKVYHEQSWSYVDLRVDWEDDGPIARLRKLWKAYEKEMDAFVIRALDPEHSPGFGVPGAP